MDFFEKISKNPYRDLEWNIPETKQGTINVIGGNSQNFRSVVKVSEFLEKNYPIENINTVLPDALREKLPNLPNFVFLTSTDSGSFADEKELGAVIENADFNIFLGDFSKNAITIKAVLSASEIAASPLIITRDGVDLIAEGNPEKALLNENIILFASLAQLQKVFRAVYYPKVLLLNQSLVQVAEIIHKFTLSYPVSLITLHEGQVLVAKNGIVKAVPVQETGYSPIMLWGGEAVAKVAALNLYNPRNFLEASVSALFL